MFKRTETGGIITRHVHVEKNAFYIDVCMPHGILYAEYDENHKLIDLLVWKL